MSPHRKLLIVVALLLILMMILGRYYDFSWWWYLVLMIPYTALLAYKSMNLDSNFYLTAHCNSPLEKNKVVALTFDDGPVEQTEVVLDILKEHNIQATFFCIGKKISSAVETLKRIDTEGHIIGNHSYRHDPVLDFFPPFLIKKDLTKTNQLIENTIHKKPLFFRPPFGVTTPSMGLAVRDLGCTVIGWNNRSYDTVPQDENNILERIEKNLKPGGIILLHDILPLQTTLLPKLIKKIEDSSYQIIPLDKLLKKEAYA